jgi:hypothetical protein
MIIWQSCRVVIKRGIGNGEIGNSETETRKYTEIHDIRRSTEKAKWIHSEMLRLLI